MGGRAGSSACKMHPWAARECNPLHGSRVGDRAGFGERPTGPGGGAGAGGLVFSATWIRNSGSESSWVTRLGLPRVPSACPIRPAGVHGRGEQQA